MDVFCEHMFVSCRGEEGLELCLYSLKRLYRTVSLQNSEAKPYLSNTKGHSTPYEKLAESLTVNNTFDYHKIRRFITVCAKSKMAAYPMDTISLSAFKSHN